MPYALCVRTLLSSALHLLLALGISFCNLVFAQENPLEFRFERRIEFRAESDVTYEVDLGEVPQNRVLDLRFDLCNESGSDRTLAAGFDLPPNYARSMLDYSILIVLSVTILP
jgi:hypothetical protein